MTILNKKGENTMKSTLTLFLFSFLFLATARGDVTLSIEKTAPPDTQFFENNSDEAILMYCYNPSPFLLKNTLWIGVAGYAESGVNRVLFHVKGKGVYKSTRITNLRDWSTSPAYWFGVTGSKRVTAESYKLHVSRPNIRNLFEIQEENVPMEIQIAVVTNDGNVVKSGKTFVITKLPGDGLRPFRYRTETK